MRGVWFLGSSSKNLLVPFLPAYCWVGAAVTEKALGVDKLMLHNMGLCSMGGWWGAFHSPLGGGRGIASASEILSSFFKNALKV